MAQRRAGFGLNAPGGPPPIGRPVRLDAFAARGRGIMEDIFGGASNAAINRGLRQNARLGRLGDRAREAVEANLTSAFTPGLWQTRGAPIYSRETGGIVGAAGGTIINGGGLVGGGAGAWTAREIRMRSLRGLKHGGLGIGLGLNLAFAPAIIGGSAMSESARWGTKTGYQEDYIGGFIAGRRQGMSQAAGSAVGELIGAVIGAPLGGVGVFAGQMIGASVGGEIAGFFTRRGSYERGRMASYAAAGVIGKHKVQFGRGFRDTEEAYTMRQQAVQEMAGSLLNARQYLGNEAFFLHR
jgi:hypothetical protein